MTKFHLFLLIATACCLGTQTSAAAERQAEFDGWTVTINPGPSSAAPAVTKLDRAMRPYAAGFRAIHTARRVAATCSSLPHHYWLKPIGSDYSLYFPWRNERRQYVFTSRYSPRTIYGYGR